MLQKIRYIDICLHHTFQLRQPLTMVDTLKVFSKVARVQITPDMGVKQHSIGLQDFSKTFAGTTVLTVWRGK